MRVQGAEDGLVLGRVGDLLVILGFQAGDGTGRGRPHSLPEYAEGAAVVQVDAELLDRIGFGGGGGEKWQAGDEEELVDRLAEGALQPVYDLLVLQVPQDDVAGLVGTGHETVRLAEGHSCYGSLVLHGEDQLGGPYVQNCYLAGAEPHCDDIDQGRRADQCDMLVALEQLLGELRVVEQYLLGDGVDQKNPVGIVGDDLVDIGDWVHNSSRIHAQMECLYVGFLIAMSFSRLGDDEDIGPDAHHHQPIKYQHTGVLFSLAFACTCGQCPLLDDMVVLDLDDRVPHHCIGVLIVQGQGSHGRLEAGRHHLDGQLLRVYLERVVADCSEGEGQGLRDTHRAVHEGADGLVGVQDGLGRVHFNFGIIISPRIALSVIILHEGPRSRCYGHCSHLQESVQLRNGLGNIPQVRHRPERASHPAGDVRGRYQRD